jgi:phage-related protein
MPWTVTVHSPAVEAELEALPADIRARFSRFVVLIESQGLEKMREPHVKHLEGRLWEMRLIGRDGIARAIYVTASGMRVVVVRAFVKKTQRTPHRELDLARQRAREVR